MANDMSEGKLDGRTANPQLCRPFAYGSNQRGFSVCNCIRRRIVCLWSAGVQEL